jgi:anti-anti-sigma factor
MEPDSSGVPSRGSDALVEVELRPEGIRGFSAVLALHGEHDMASAAAVSDALDTIHGNILVDLSNCAFIDSTTIGVLIRRSQDLKSEGHYLEIVAPPSNTVIARTLDVVRMRDLIVVHPARPNADPE